MHADKCVSCCLYYVVMETFYSALLNQDRKETDNLETSEVYSLSDYEGETNNIGK